jgi:hypothetical protein
MSKWSGTGLTIDEAILVAEHHPDVTTVTEAYARTSRASTRDRPQDALTPGWDA